MKIAEFQEKFKSIKDMGFVRSQRAGATGIGYTLESLLGISENNKANPDIERVELKAPRTNVNGLITLFTFNNKIWKMPPLEAVKNMEALIKTADRECIVQCL